uniref:Uncharacterized protein n=1 Tax=Magallana gigas TaxID=29159 RepID=K1QRZ5_MAGGI
MNGEESFSMPLNNHNQFLTDLQRKSTCNTAVEETLIYPIPKDTQFVCIRREKVTVRSNGDVEAVQEVVEDELVEEVEADEIQMAAAASD